jgi:hypothetical protein
MRLSIMLEERPDYEALWPKVLRITAQITSAVQNGIAKNALARDNFRSCFVFVLFQSNVEEGKVCPTRFCTLTGGDSAIEKGLRSSEGDPDPENDPGPPASR